MWTGGARRRRPFKLVRRGRILLSVCSVWHPRKSVGFISPSIHRFAIYSLRHSPSIHSAISPSIDSAISPSIHSAQQSRLNRRSTLRRTLQTCTTWPTSGKPPEVVWLVLVMDAAALSLSHTHSLSHTPHTLSHTLSLSHTYTLSHTQPLSHTHSLSLVEQAEHVEEDPSNLYDVADFSSQHALSDTYTRVLGSCRLLFTISPSIHAANIVWTGGARRGGPLKLVPCTT